MDRGVTRGIAEKNSDASAEANSAVHGRRGVRSFRGGRFDAGAERTFPSHIPAWVVAEESDIGVFEMVGALYGVCVARLLYPGRSIMLCCDNDGAAAALIRGYCKSELARAMCSVIGAISATRALNLWIEHVPGPINPADPPPRGCPRCEHSFRVPRKELLAPGLFARVFESNGSLVGSRFNVGGRPRGSPGCAAAPL